MSDFKVVRECEKSRASIVECPVCGGEYNSWGVKQHWCAMHDEVIPRPWWSAVDETERRGPRYVWARRQVLARDDHQCQRCGRSEEEVSRLEAHHIVPFHDFEIPGRAHAPRNHLTVCSDCHTAVEGLTPQELVAVLETDSPMVGEHPPLPHISTDVEKDEVTDIDRYARQLQSV